jgi:hypothetical protein
MGVKSVPPTLPEKADPHEPDKLKLPSNLPHPCAITSRWNLLVSASHGSHAAPEQPVWHVTRIQTWAA